MHWGCCDFFPLWAQQGVLLDLRPFVQADLDRETVNEWDQAQYRALFRSDGLHFALPKYHGALALFYNKHLFDHHVVDYPDDPTRCLMGQPEALQAMQWIRDRMWSDRTMATTDGFGIYAGTRYPEAAWELLKFLVSKEYGRAMAQAHGEHPHALQQLHEVVQRLPEDRDDPSGVFSTELRELLGYPSRPEQDLTVLALRLTAASANPS